MINPRIKLFNDELQDTIGQALKNKINNQAELSVPKKDLLDKIKYANNFENYVEVFNIVYNINNRKQDSNEEKDVQVISVKR